MASLDRHSLYVFHKNMHMFAKYCNITINYYLLEDHTIHDTIAYMCHVSVYVCVISGHFKAVSGIII